MSRSYLYCLPFLWLAISCPAHGGVIERDWKVAGDGLLTYDNVNQREWLDLSETLLENFPGESLVERYQNTIAELNASGVLEEFTVAKNGDVVELAISACIDTSTKDFQTNHMSTSMLIGLLGETASFSGGRVFSEFLLDDDNLIFLQAQFFINPRSGRTGVAGYLASNSSDIVGPLGLMVYREYVPEPSTIAMFIFVFLGTMSTKFRKCLSPGRLNNKHS